MTIKLTEEQEQLIEGLLATGRFKDDTAVLTRSLKMMQEHEQRLAQLHADLHKAQEDIAAGRCRTISTPEEGQALADEIKQRARGLRAEREQAAH